MISKNKHLDINYIREIHYITLLQQTHFHTSSNSILRARFWFTVLSSFLRVWRNAVFGLDLN